MNWVEKRIKDFSFISSGEAITNSDLIDEGFEVFGGNGLMGYTNKFNVKNEAIIIGRVGAKCGNIRYINSKKWISDNALILKLKSNKNSYNFLSYLLYIKNLGSLSTSTAQPLITGSKILNLNVSIPFYLTEQQAIANYLDAKTQAIDKKVTLLEQKIETYKKLKRTLSSTKPLPKGYGH